MARKPYTTRRVDRTFLCGLISATQALLLSPAAPAQATRPAAPPAATRPAKPQPFPAMRRWFEELANPDSDVRSDALVALMGLRPDDLPAFRTLVEESRPLAPNQVVVLRQIVTQVYMSGLPYDAVPGRGFVGIRFPLSIEEPDGVVVDSRLPGFIGARMLRDGDLILGIVEKPFSPVRTSTEFTELLKGEPAGRSLHLEVCRQGRVIQVPITLDPFPVEAGSGDIDLLRSFLVGRSDAAERYWGKYFADLVTEGVT